MNQQMTVEEFMESLKQDKFKDYSSTFNENVQTAYQTRLFNRLKFEPRIAKYLFVPMLLTFPFDPLTGSTEKYNMRQPYRPSQRPEFFLTMIKAVCHQNEELKKHYTDMADFTGVWDTKPTKYLTDDDRTILFRYRRPLTVSQPSVRINSTSITGEKYGGVFLLNTQQDPLTGVYMGEVCPLQKLGFLANAAMRAEIDSFQKAVEESTPNCLSIDLGRGFMTPKLILDIKDLKGTEAMNTRSSIRACYPVGSVAQLRVLPLIALDVTPISGKITTYVTLPDGEEDEELLTQFRTKINFEEHFYATDKFAILDRVDAIVGHYYPKDPSKRKERNAETDLHADFAVLEYITADETQVFKSDIERNAAAIKLEAAPLRNPLFDRRKKKFTIDGLEQFFENMAEFYDYAQRDGFLDRMPSLLFANYKVATPTIEERALDIFAKAYPLEDYMDTLYSKEIRATHADILMAMFPEEYAESVETIEDKLEEGQEALEQLIDESTELTFDTEDSIEIDNVDEVVIG